MNCQHHQVIYLDDMLDNQFARNAALAMLNEYGRSQLTGPFDLRKVGISYLQDAEMRAAINKIVGVG